MKLQVTCRVEQMTNLLVKSIKFVNLWKMHDGLIMNCFNFVDTKLLFTTQCLQEPLKGSAIYFMRANTNKSLGEEAFQVRP